MRARIRPPQRPHAVTPSGGGSPSARSAVSQTVGNAADCEEIEKKGRSGRGRGAIVRAEPDPPETVRPQERRWKPARLQGARSGRLPWPVPRPAHALTRSQRPGYDPRARFPEDDRLRYRRLPGKGPGPHPRSPLKRTAARRRCAGRSFCFTPHTNTRNPKMGGAVKIEEVRISRAEATQSQTSWRSSTAHRWPRV